MADKEMIEEKIGEAIGPSDSIFSDGGNVASIHSRKCLPAKSIQLGSPLQPSTPKTQHTYYPY